MARKEIALVPLAAFATSDTSLGYTSPAAGSGVDTITSIHVANNDGSAQTFTIAQGGEAVGTDQWKAVSVASGATFDWNGRLTLPASTTLHGHASSANVNVQINGIRDY